MLKINGDTEWHKKLMKSKVPITYWMNNKTISILYYSFYDPYFALNYISHINAFNLLKYRSNVISFSHNTGFVEAMIYLYQKKYKVKNINNHVKFYPLSYYTNNYRYSILDDIKSIYNLDNNPVVKPLTNNYITTIINQSITNTKNTKNKYDIVNIDPFIFDRGVIELRENLNTQLFISLIVISLSILEKDGTLIMIIPNIKNEITHQLLFILQSVFDKMYNVFRKNFSADDNKYKNDYQFVFKGYKSDQNVIKQLFELII